MDNWTTVISFVFPHEAYIAKGKLESEGIETIIQDELTAQTNNFYSNAIGGVKLLVKESDFRKAYDILIESKWIIEKKEKKTISTRNTKNKLLSAKLLHYSSITIAAIAAGAILVAFYLIPSTSERLTRNRWCFNSMYYDNYEFFPNTLKPEKSINAINFKKIDECEEYIDFLSNGKVILPGFNSESIQAFWKIDNKIITLWPINGDMTLVNSSKVKVLSDEESTENIYYGTYKVKFESNFLILENENVIIYGTRYARY